MPRGWYLAQGLVPLGYSSSDDEEGPCTLPNGKIVCGPHGREWCHKCCMDFTVMNEEIDDENDFYDDDDHKEGEEDAVDPDEELVWDRINEVCTLGHRMHEACTLGSSSSSDSSEIRRGTGAVFPVEFVPPSPSTSPLDIFSGRRAFMKVTRFTLPHETLTGLICTDGACLENGQANPKAGWAFWHGQGPAGEKLVASARLEKVGPFGDPGPQTSNRAELRAVIAALGFRFWPGEGFRKIVIATDSEYIVQGATKWAKTWIKNGWKTKSHAAVKNKDMWQALLGQVEEFKRYEMAVEFWRIPREWNAVADRAAKEAAAEEDAPETWSMVSGINL